jgi:hypothetical protein
MRESGNFVGWLKYSNPARVTSYQHLYQDTSVGVPTGTLSPEGFLHEYSNQRSELLTMEYEQQLGRLIVSK